MNRKDRIIGAPHTAPDTVLFTYTVHTYQRMFAAIVCLQTVKQIFSEPHMQFLVCIDGQGRSQIFELQLHVINGNSRWATKQGVIPTLGIK